MINMLGIFCTVRIPAIIIEKFLKVSLFLDSPLIAIFFYDREKECDMMVA